MNIYFTRNRLYSFGQLYNRGTCSNTYLWLHEYILAELIQTSVQMEAHSKYIKMAGPNLNIDNCQEVSVVQESKEDEAGEDDE